ncbi:hypothetical protein Tco_1180273, partial [Tanacetum coccineum]
MHFLPVNMRGINDLDIQELGKHVMLPFVSSNTSITSRFDIIHSDVWTSPIPSLSASNWLECLPAGSISTWEDLTTQYLRSIHSTSEGQPKSTTISSGGKLHDLNPEESWAILEDLALYDNESWNDPRDFAKSVKAIALPQDVPMVHMTLRFAWKTLNKPSLNMHPRIPMKREDARLSRFEADFKQQQNEMTNKIDTVLKAITNQIAGTLPSDTDQFTSIATEQVRKLNSMLESLGLVPRSSNTKFVCSKEDDGEVMFIEIIRDDDEPQNEGEGAPTEEPIVEYFDTFQTR